VDLESKRAPPDPLAALRDPFIHPNSYFMDLPLPNLSRIDQHLGIATNPQDLPHLPLLQQLPFVQNLNQPKNSTLRLHQEENPSQYKKGHMSKHNRETADRKVRSRD
jgi:hypothetical protein